MTSKLDAVVIGAGANGLVAAAALGRAGLRVLVLERGDTVAGQAGLIEFASGFFAAPLAIEPGWVPPVVQRGLRLEPLETTTPESPFAVLVAPGELLALPRDPMRAADTIRRHSPMDAAKWPAFVEQLHRLAEFLGAVYQLPAPDIDTARVREAWPLLRLARTFRRLGREDMTELLRMLPMPVQQLAEDWFDCEPLRAAIAAAGIRDIQHGPRSGGTGFVLLHYLVGAAAGCVRRSGVWHGGLDAFSAAVARATPRRVTIRTGARVTRIMVADDAVTGVVLDTGEEIQAPRVISAADPVRTLLGMVDPVWLDPELLLALRNVRFRGCTAFVLYALDGLPDVPGVENPTETLSGIVSLTPATDALERAADAVKYGSVPQRPHVEITVPSLRSHDLAPEHHHVLVARVHYTPYQLRDGEWDAARKDALAQTVTAALEDAIPCLTSRMLHRSTLSPRDIEERFALTEGAATHGELGLDQILFMRPVPGLGRYETPIAGLYLCGAGSHPGPGVLGGPGWLAARRVLGR